MLAIDPPSKPMSLVFKKLSVILLAVVPLLHSPAIYIILKPVSIILKSFLRLLKSAFTLLFAFVVLPDISISISIQIATEAMSLVIFELALIDISILIQFENTPAI